MSIPSLTQTVNLIMDVLIKVASNAQLDLDYLVAGANVNLLIRKMQLIDVHDH